jgi:hypothetical protein
MNDLAVVEEIKVLLVKIFPAEPSKNMHAS